MALPIEPGDKISFITAVEDFKPAKGAKVISVMEPWVKISWTHLEDRDGTEQWINFDHVVLFQTGEWA